MTKQNRVNIPLFFFLTSLILYSVAIRNQGFFWDDEQFYFLNPDFLNAKNIFSFWDFSSQSFRSWPATYSFFWFFWVALDFKEVWLYKVINVFSHTACSILLFKLLKKNNLKHSFFLSCIFHFHPVAVEVVSWVSQFSILASTLFFIASYLCILSYIETNNKLKLYSSLVLFFISLSFKSIYVLAPLLFYSMFYLHKKKSKLILIYFIFSFTSAYLSLRGFERVENKIQISESNQKSVLQQEQVAATQDFQFTYVENSFPVSFSYEKNRYMLHSLIFYPIYYLLPFQNTFIYPFVELNTVLSGLILVFFIFLVCKYFSLKERFNFFLLLFVGYLPISGFFKIPFFYWSPLADRYLYTYSVFILIFLGLVINKFNLKIPHRVKILIISLLIVRTIFVAVWFNSPLRFYEDINALKKHPYIISMLFEEYLVSEKYNEAKALIIKAEQEFPTSKLVKQCRLKMDSILGNLSKE